MVVVMILARRRRRRRPPREHGSLPLRCEAMGCVVGERAASVLRRT